MGALLHTRIKKQLKYHDSLPTKKKSMAEKILASVFLAVNGILIDFLLTDTTITGVFFLKKKICD